jgi:hypothetical protein
MARKSYPWVHLWLYQDKAPTFFDVIMRVKINYLLFTTESAFDHRSWTALALIN